MPPKAEAGSGSDAFLVACIKCAKAKLEVDFDALSKATGMSKGGASNKFRALMKQFEDEGALGVSNTAKKTPQKRKNTPKTATPTSEASEDGGNQTDEEKQPSAKKPKRKPAPKKKAAAATKEKKKAAAASTSDDETKEDDQEGASGEDVA